MRGYLNVKLNLYLTLEFNPAVYRSMKALNLSQDKVTLQMLLETVYIERPPQRGLHICCM